MVSLHSYGTTAHSNSNIKKVDLSMIPYHIIDSIWFSVFSKMEEAGYLKVVNYALKLVFLCKHWGTRVYRILWERPYLGSGVNPPPIHWLWYKQSPICLDI